MGTHYRNRDGKRSFQGQLYFEKAKSIPDINTVFLVVDKSEAIVDVERNQSTIRTYMEGKLVDCEPLVISPLGAHSRKPNLQVVLDTGNRSGYNLISANVVSRYKLKKSKRRSLGLRTFNDVKKTYNYEVTIRLSLPIIRYEKETNNTTFELNCLVVKDLC